MDHNTINISSITILKILFIALLVWFLFAIREIVLLFVIAIIVSAAMDPVADFFRKYRIPRGISVLLVYVLFLGLIALVGFLLVPTMIDQFQSLQSNNFVSHFQEKIGPYKDALARFGIDKSVTNTVEHFRSGLAGNIFQTTKGVATGVVSFITVLVISFYLTAEENGMKNFIRHLSPYKHQAYVMNLVTKIQRKMGYWLLGQLILSVVVFGVVYVGLTILKVDYALVLALIAGVLEIIPYIGPFIAGGITAFFAFLQSPGLALAAVIFFIVVQELEGHVLVPIIMSKSVGLNPVMIILAILVGGTLGGIVGALIAVPIASGVSVFVNDVLEQYT
ncbi:MAG: AI-2E family transporter [Candidatus Doudnabacteria bacterium]|nr:AI-2E family transporter [Candidatus Doudnabacteria bacterium]